MSIVIVHMCLRTDTQNTRFLYRFFRITRHRTCRIHRKGRNVLLVRGVRNGAKILFRNK